MMGTAYLLLGILACQGLSLWASPVHKNAFESTTLQDLPILVPDTGKIESAALKSISADKFLSLWFVYVLSGEVVVSDEPSTVFIPLNSGLPKDPSFLTDKEFTKEILLNQVVIGDIISKTSPDLFYTLADSELLLSQEGEDFFVNGIRLTGDEFTFGNVKIYIIEETIPFLEPEFFDYIADAPVKPEPIIKERKSDLLNFVDNNDLFARIPKEKATETQTTEASPSSTTTEAPRPTTAAPSSTTAAPISTTASLEAFTETTNIGTASTTSEVFVATRRSTSSRSKAVTEKPTSDVSARPTRFDKFRNRAGNEVSKDQKKPVEGEKLSQIVVEPTQKESTTELSTTQDLEVAGFEDGIQSTTEALVNIFETFLPGTEKKPDGNENSTLELEGGFLEEEFGAESLGSNDSTFYSSLMKELNHSNYRASEFVHHFNDVHLDIFIEPDTNYTAIIPTNAAFYNYYPIDWGFNPFLVENFTKDVLLNHIMEGDIHLQMFNDSVEIQTIAGRIIKVTKDKDGNLLVNGNMIPAEFEVELDHGRIYYVDQLLFVDYNRVNKLRESNPWVETAPLLGFPWPSSPFLSHLLQRLQENNDTKLFAHLLQNSDIAHMVSSSDEDLNRLTYTAFVPNDEALKKTLGDENLAVLEQKAINDFLLEHIVSGYLFKEDFEEGFNLLSLSNSALPIKMSNGDIFIGPSKIMEPQQYVYNLGTIFMIDTPFESIAINSAKQVASPQVSDVKIISLPLEAQDSSGVSAAKGDQGAAPVTEPQVQYEVRTEISFSRQINNGKIEPIPREFIARVNAL